MASPIEGRELSNKDEALGAYRDLIEDWTVLTGSFKDGEITEAEYYERFDGILEAASTILDSAMRMGATEADIFRIDLDLAGQEAQQALFLSQQISGLPGLTSSQIEELKQEFGLEDVDPEQKEELGGYFEL